MSQPQYEAYAKDQLKRELSKPDAFGYYGEDRMKSLIQQLEDRYHGENVGLKAQVAALKRENELIWEKYIQDIAQLRLLELELKKRIKDIETSNI